MPRVPVRNVGGLGIVPDIPPHELPPEAWSSGENVTFQDNYITRALGNIQVEGTPSGAPYYLFPSPSLNTLYWVYTNLTNVYAVAGGTHTDITKLATTYAGGVDDVWTGGWLNGILVLNNGLDTPQLWSPIDPATRLVDLTNWPANTTCKVMRVFQEFLFALDVTESGTRYPTVLRWSHPADPGSPPSSWDYTLATNLSGRAPIGDTPGFLVDAVPVGNALLVWKEDSVHRMDRVTSNAVFVRRRVGRAGLMAVRCAQEFTPGLQVALTRDADVVVTDGQPSGMRSLVDRRIRKYLEENISIENRARSFVVVDRRNKQVYICYPKSGDNYCTEAAVWDWGEDTWGFKELDSALDIKDGLYDQSASPGTWDSVSDTWDAMIGRWDGVTLASDSANLLGAYPTASKIRLEGVGYDRDGTGYTSFVERKGLALAGVDRQGNPKVDPSRVKLITSVYPIINSETSMTMQISIGSQETPQGPVLWEGPYNFNSGDGLKVDCFTTGRYFAIKFSSTSQVNWKMVGYELDVALAGE